MLFLLELSLVPWINEVIYRSALLVVLIHVQFSWLEVSGHFCQHFLSDVRVINRTSDNFLYVWNGIKCWLDMLFEGGVRNHTHSVTHHNDHIIKQGHQHLTNLSLIGCKHLHFEAHGRVEDSLLTTLLFHFIEQHVHRYEVRLNQCLNWHIINQSNESLQTTLIFCSQSQ